MTYRVKAVDRKETVESFEVVLEPVQLAKSVGYSARELSEIRNLIVENVDVFKRRWDEYFGHQSF